MTQKIKVQDGNIVYSNSDPTQPANMTVLGTATVTDEFTVGNINSPIDGVISTGDGTLSSRARLDITTGLYGDLNIYQSPTDGQLFLNNARWPSGATQPIPGMFIGSSALNELEYYKFVIANNPNDSLTSADLIALYPNAQTGQSVVGPTVVYQCVGTNSWRILGNGGGGGAIPVNQVAFGTGSSLTSSSDLTFDPSTQILSVIGTAGTGLISSEPSQALQLSSDVSITLTTNGINALEVSPAGTVVAGPLSVGPVASASIKTQPAQTLTIDSDISVTLSTNNISRLTIGTTGAFSVNGSAGTSGQALVSNGSGTSPTWQTVGGSSTVAPSIFQLIGGSTTTMDGTVMNRWFETDVSLGDPSVTWDSYGNQAVITGEVGHIYRVDVNMVAQISGSWQNQLIQYGTSVPAALSYAQKSQYSITATGSGPTNDLNAINVSPQWTDTFFVSVSSDPTNVQIGGYMNMYNGASHNCTFNAVVAMTRVS